MVHNLTERAQVVEEANTHSSAVVSEQGQQHLLPAAAADMYAFCGSRGELPFTKSPTGYRFMSTALKLEQLEFQSPGMPSAMKAKITASVMRRANDVERSSLLSAMRHLLQEDFPEPQRRVGVSIPQQPAEKQSVELLLLETLAELVEEGENMQAQEWVQQVEAEADASLKEVLQDARRADMERSIQEQNAEHALIVAKHAARARSMEGGAAVAVTGVLDSGLHVDRGDSSSILSSPQSAVVEADDTLTQRAQSRQTARRVKYRFFASLLRRVLKARSLTSEPASTTVTVAGSHLTLHSRNSQSLTLVRVHGSKDSTMGGRYATRLAEKLMALTTQLGFQR